MGLGYINPYTFLFNEKWNNGLSYISQAYLKFFENQLTIKVVLLDVFESEAFL